MAASLPPFPEPTRAYAGYALALLAAPQAAELRQPKRHLCARPAHRARPSPDRHRHRVDRLRIRPALLRGRVPLRRAERPALPARRGHRRRGDLEHLRLPRRACRAASGGSSLFRAAVGIGTAAFTAAAASLVADYFPGRRRAVATRRLLPPAFPSAAMLGIALGGQLETFYGWRIAMMAVAVPGLLLAALVARLTDPNRPPPTLTVRAVLAPARARRRRRLPDHVATPPRGGVPAASPRGFSTAGTAPPRPSTSRRSPPASASDWPGNLVLVVRRTRRTDGSFDFTAVGSINDALGEMRLAVDTVLRTPTLKYLFVGGALVSFGMNGLVGWAPTFMARTHGIEPGAGHAAARSVGTAGRDGRHACRGFPGRLAGEVHRTEPDDRVDPRAPARAGRSASGCWRCGTSSLFVPVFAVAFFFLTLYNGPVIAAVFDVVPARIGATVIGRLPALHPRGGRRHRAPAGGLPVRPLRDRPRHLHPAVGRPLPAACVLFFGVRTVLRDMRFVAARTTATHPVVVAGPRGSGAAGQ